ncbi:hypothetical protein [Rhizobium leguminosarum]|uniref:hypothetical protein n=1 Tax=Rhizobium leguminosarum TaxID=384 RepID=UPI001031C6B7|nr:hypothetical protein [Rhizobium leguminosarum]TBF40459.1 hypothetical protein ELG92_10495 [Rhizobium leguminosarum]
MMPSWLTASFVYPGYKSQAEKGTIQETAPSCEAHVKRIDAHGPIACFETLGKLNLASATVIRIGRGGVRNDYAL